MPLDLAEVKKHPYAIGTVVIVGGIVVFYLLSQQGSSAGAPASGNSDYLAASSAEAQAQAAAAIQTNGQNASIQQSQIAASVANNQTAAAVTANNTNTLASLIASLFSAKTNLAVTQSNNDAATLQQLNQETSNQNIFNIQEAGIENQQNQAYDISANTNATNLEGLQDTLAATGAIASKQLDVENQNLSSAYDLSTHLADLGGQQAGTTISNVLASAYGQQSNPQAVASIVESGNNASAATSISNNALLASIAKTGGSVLASIFG